MFLHADSEDSDQTGHLLALSGYLRTQCFFMRTAKTLIRLGGCPGCSESSLGAQSFCWFCHVAAQRVLATLGIILFVWRITKTLFGLRGRSG